MLILAFDTTSPDGSAALFKGAERLGELRIAGQANYSVALFEMVGRLLGEAGVTLAEIELFAAATGPGSFTGIRVGLAAAQGWAKAFGRPVRGVSVLEALVTAARPRAPIAVPLLDARRAEFYLGIFRREGTGDSEGRRFSLSGEGLVLNAARIAGLVEELAPGGYPEIDFIARETDRAALELANQLPPTAAWSTVRGHHAGTIARVAWLAAREGRLQQPDELDAWYIRRSDAEMNWAR